MLAALPKISFLQKVIEIMAVDRREGAKVKVCNHLLWEASVEDIMKADTEARVEAVIMRGEMTDRDQKERVNKRKEWVCTITKANQMRLLVKIGLECKKSKIHFLNSRDSTTEQIREPLVALWDRIKALAVEGSLQHRQALKARILSTST